MIGLIGISSTPPILFFACIVAVWYSVAPRRKGKIIASAWIWLAATTAFLICRGVI